GRDHEERIAGIDGLYEGRLGQGAGGQVAARAASRQSTRERIANEGRAAASRRGCRRENQTCALPGQGGSCDVREREAKPMRDWKQRVIPAQAGSSVFCSACKDAAFPLSGDDDRRWSSRSQG